MKKILVFLMIFGMMIGCAGPGEENLASDSQISSAAQAKKTVHDDLYFTRQSAEGGDYVYTFEDGKIPAFQEGDMIVVHNWPVSHDYREIVGVEKIDDNTVKLQTVDSTLFKALPNGDVRFSSADAIEVAEYTIDENGAVEITNQVSREELRKLNPQNFEQTRGSLSWTKSLSMSKSYSRVKIYNSYLSSYLSGKVTLTPSASVTIKHSWGVPNYFKAVTNANLKIEVNAEAVASKRYSLKKSKKILGVGKTFLMFITGIPVWFDLKGRVDLEANVSAEGHARAGVKVTGEYSYTYGKVWKKGDGWKNYSGNGFRVLRKAGYTPSYDKGAKMIVKAGPVATVTVQVDSITGPMVTIAPYLKLNAYSSGSWYLYEGADVDFWVKSALFGGVVPAWGPRNLYHHQNRLKSGKLY
jgi:hypothetical protein